MGLLFGNIKVSGKPDPTNIQRLDLLPLRQVQRMQRIGIEIDKEWMNELTIKFEAKKILLRQNITNFIPAERLEEFAHTVDDEDESNGFGINVDSAEQIGRLLFRILGIGADRQLKRTKSGTRISTGKKQMETLKRDHPIIPLILEYRELSKLVNTYTNKLPQLARLHPEAKECSLCGIQHIAASWRVHGQITYTRAATGRFQMKQPNLFNIPARTKNGRDVRKGFRASKGKKLVGTDLAQIELRCLADRAQERNMIRIFQGGGDIHLDTACRAFNLDYNYYSDLANKKAKKVITPAEQIIWDDFALMNRAPCKNVNFGILFGLSPMGLLDLMAVTFATAQLSLPDWCTYEWCEAFIEKWFDLYPDAAEYFELQEFRARRYGVTWDMFGRCRRIPEVQSNLKRVVAAGLRQAVNMTTQGANAGILKIGMARVEQRFEQARKLGIHCEALLPIYDEVLAEVDEEWAEEIADVMKFELESALTDQQGVVQSRVLIKSDGKISEQWSKD